MALKKQEWKVEIIYCPGVSNGYADALSRQQEWKEVVSTADWDDSGGPGHDKELTLSADTDDRITSEKGCATGGITLLQKSDGALALHT